MYDVVECGMQMVTALTPNTAEAMRAQVIHVSPAMETNMRTTEGGTKAEAHRYSYSPYSSRERRWAGRSTRRLTLWLRQP